MELTKQIEKGECPLWLSRRYITPVHFILDLLLDKARGILNNLMKVNTKITEMKEFQKV